LIDLLLLTMVIGSGMVGYSIAGMIGDRRLNIERKKRWALERQIYNEKYRQGLLRIAAR
jgi:hypothetical protein